jgi:RNA polymerase sigma-70 factor (ECF subfamily)
MSDISNDLVMKAARGDMAAFEEIYKAASGFVYNVALRITNSPRDADEVTQDVFIKVHKNLRDFGFRSAFKTWIYRITANTALNHCKSRSRRERGNVEYDPVVHDIASPDCTVAEGDKEDAEKKVTALLELLDPDQRACIVLREIEGLDYKTIADTLKININTVRSRLKRAREKLVALTSTVSLERKG